MGLTLVTAPNERVLSAAQLRDHLRLAHTQMDTSVLEPLIDDAVDFIQSRLQMQFCPAVWKYTESCFPCGRKPVEIRLPPVREVTSFKYWDTNGEEQTITDFQLDGSLMPAELIPAVGKSWPSTQTGRSVAFEITFSAGWESEDEIPGEVRRMVRLLAGHWFVNPEAVATGPVSGPVALAFNDLLNSMRWKW